MFRSAAEISSDSSDESDHELVTATPTSPESKPRAIDKGVKSPPLLTSENVEPYSGRATPKDPLDAEPEGHANLMTAALLEFYCMSRAADILNAQPGSQMRFTRDSPEVQYLGKKMYAYKSQFLSSHGVLPDGIEKDEWGTTRQYYRDNLDVLGVSALEDLNLRDTAERAPALGATGDVVLASKSTKSAQLRSTNERIGPSRPQLRRPKLSDIGKRLTSAERIGPLEDIRLDFRSLPTQSFPHLSSSPVSFTLFDNPPPSLRLSRYAMEFSEVRMLGRGSFGEVYHVKNHIDGQSYAVKKIPLSQRRLEQLQRGGENQLESIMKEIRTLARLEHTNVVRYYGAWVEQAHVSGYMPPHEDDDSIEPNIDDGQNNLLSHGGPESQSFGIVFEDSESADFAQVKSSVEHESMTSTRSRRRSSHATATSRSSKKSSFQSVGEEHEDVESIPRDMLAFSHGMSTFGDTDDIFTDGYSHDPSKLQVQRRPNRPQIPAVVLHIQMSLHPISLSSYLNPQADKTRRDCHNAIPRRHCFHLVASLKLMLSIMSGVDYLHSKGIVHRDLKPANIFLSTPDNRDLDGCSSCQSSNYSESRYCHPRIGDFGLVADISHFNDNCPVDHDSKINRIVGTEFYRPPFIANNIGELGETPELDHAHVYKIDETLDMYALGVILFELLYRLNTKMERQMVLSDLTRGPHGQSQSGPSARRPSFPGDFARKIDMGDSVLEDGVTVAQSLMTCITGMLEPLPSRRWHCSKVMNYLRRILSAAEKLSCS